MRKPDSKKQSDLVNNIFKSQDSNPGLSDSRLQTLISFSLFSIRAFLHHHLQKWHLAESWGCSFFLLASEGLSTTSNIHCPRLNMLSGNDQEENALKSWQAISSTWLGLVHQREEAHQYNDTLNSPGWPGHHTFTTGSWDTVCSEKLDWWKLNPECLDQWSLTVIPGLRWSRVWPKSAPPMWQPQHNSLYNVLSVRDNGVRLCLLP